MRAQPKAAVRKQVMCCSWLSGRSVPLTGISGRVLGELGLSMAASHPADHRSDVAIGTCMRVSVDFLVIPKTRMLSHLLNRQQGIGVE